MTTAPSRPTALQVPPYAATVPAMLAAMAAAWPDREAIVGYGQRLSFAGLEAESAKMARGLIAQGVGKGTRVGLLAANSPQWLSAFFAITRIGAIAVPLSTLYQPPELGWAIRHADIAHMIITARYLRHDYVAKLETAFPELASQRERELWMADAPYLRRIHVIGDTDRAWATPWPEAVLAGHPVTPAMLAAAEAQVSPADLLFMLYTSGSTAEPKAVMHAHGKAVRYSYGMGRDYVVPDSGDRIATTRPFFWVAGLIPTLFCCLQKGVTIVCPKSGSGPNMLAAIAEEGLTAIVGREAWMAETIADPAIEASPFTAIRLTYDYSAIATVDPASGALTFRNPAVEARYPARLGGPPAERMPRHYGMTETMGTWVTEPSFMLAPEGLEWTCGHPVPGTEHRLVDPKTNTDVPQGELGELLVRGAPLMEGLYKRERHELFDADGYYRTGDLCEFDADGYLFVRSRLGEMIKVKGANVAPAEVERWLMQLPGIAEAIVVGIPTADGKDSILTAAVVPTPAATLDEAAITADLKTRLSTFKVPKTIVILPNDAVPRTGSGKVARAKLTDLLAEHVARQAAVPARAAG